MSNSYYNSTFTAAIGTLARSSTLRAQFLLVETGVTAMEAALAPKASPTFTGNTTLANVSYSGTLTGGTGVVNIGSGQFYKDSSGSVGIGTTTPSAKLDVVQGSGDGGLQYRSSSRTIGIGQVGGEAALYWGSTTSLIFYSGGVERGRIDGNGNMGLGATANAAALLDVQSTTKGFRLPNMTTTQKNAISSAPAGLMVFDTTLGKACVYSGAGWETITSA